MSVITWLRSRLSGRYRANWYYQRGMILAKARRNEAAIADYTEVIDMPEADPTMRAMARYNRALILWTLGTKEKALDDLNQVLLSPQVPENVKTEARRKLLRIDRSFARTAERDRSR